MKFKNTHHINTNGTRVSPYPRRNPTEPPPDIDMLRRVSLMCSNATKMHRNIRWTDYVRTNVPALVKYKSFNIGLPIEPAIECSICKRVLPLCLMTGDHVIPQSNRIEMRKVIAYQYDKIDAFSYEYFINYNFTVDKNGYKSLDINAPSLFKHIKHYDDNLEYDLRNIQTACFSCNTKKGSKLIDNHKLFSNIFPNVKKFSREI
jgi:5-methylcytosine-specific restriction endonuclease McrA